MKVHVKLLFFAVALVSCESQQELSQRSGERKVFEHQAFNPLDLDPTNPDGGIVEGRLKSLTPEENLRRKQQNEVQPIIWGDSVAGISMATTYEQARDILAEPIGSVRTTEFFPEGIRVNWLQSDPKLPSMIIIDAEYKGTLSLSADLDFVMGKSGLPAGQEPDVFMKLIGAELEGEDPASYDCVTAFTCRMEEGDNFLTFDFAKGGMLWDNGDSSLQIMYFTSPRQLRPFLTTPFIYGESVAGVSKTTTRAEAEDFLGPPLLDNNGFFFYDNFNFVVQWLETDLPGLMIAQDGFRGAFQLSADSQYFIGDSMRDLAPDGEVTPSGLAKALYRTLHNAADSDCIADNECSVIEDEDVTEIQLPDGFFGVSNDGNLNLDYFGM